MDDQTPTGHDPGGRPSCRGLHADRLARPERPPGRRACHLRARPPGHRVDGIRAEHAGARAHAGPDPDPRGRRLRARLLRAIAHPDRDRAASGDDGLRDHADPDAPPRDRRRRGPAPQPRSATGGRRHLGDPGGRRQPPHGSERDAWTSRSRSSSWVVCPASGRSPRSGSTIAPSGASPRGTCSPVGRGGSASSPGRWTGGNHSSASQDGATRSSPRASRRPTSSSSRVTGRLRAESTGSTGWSSGYRPSTPCSRATTRWRSACCTAPTGSADAFPTSFPSSGWTTSPRARISGRRSPPSISPCAMPARSRSRTSTG